VEEADEGEMLLLESTWDDPNVTRAFLIFRLAKWIAFLRYKIVFLVTTPLKLLSTCLCE